MKNFVRMVILSAVIAVGLSGCGDDNGADDGGDSHESVTIGGKKWMKKNLNVETADSWCYDDDPANCDKHGRLYTWEAAKAACQSVGMRLPSREEWDALVTAAGGESTAGKKLKAISGWNDNGNGTNETGFSALPCGFRISDDDRFDFMRVGEYGLWWASTEYGRDRAFGLSMFYLDDNVHENHNDKSHIAISVRCVK
jgi:uncharacterized protein (TIGR02145 family)